jgi:hypothetical protein
VPPAESALQRRNGSPPWGCEFAWPDLGGNTLEQAVADVASLAKRGSSDVLSVPTDVSKLEDGSTGFSPTIRSKGEAWCTRLLAAG